MAHLFTLHTTLFTVCPSFTKNRPTEKSRIIKGPDLITETLTALREEVVHCEVFELPDVQGFFH